MMLEEVYWNTGVHVRAPCVDVWEHGAIWPKSTYKLRRLHVLPHVFVTPTATICVPCILYEPVPPCEFQQVLTLVTHTSSHC